MSTAADSKPIFLPICLFFLCSLITETAYAAVSQATDTENIFRVIWGLLVVLGVTLALYALLRKRFSLLSNTSERAITIVEMKPLLGRKALCLISVKGNEYLLGISGDRINHLATLPKETSSSFAETLQTAERKGQV